MRMRHPKDLVSEDWLHQTADPSTCNLEYRAPDLQGHQTPDVEKDPAPVNSPHDTVQTYDTSGTLHERLAIISDAHYGNGSGWSTWKRWYSGNPPDDLYRTREEYEAVLMQEMENTERYRG